MGTRLKVYDRSRSTTDWQCPRKRYLAYEFGGKGIAPDSNQLELYLGTTLHDGLSAIALQHREAINDPPPSGVIVDIDLITSTARKQVYEALSNLPSDNEFEQINFANEQATLIEGLLLGFYIHVWPVLIAQYPRIIAIEEEMVYEHDGFKFMSKPDLVLATDDESEVVYVEYKSTSSKKESWVNSWSTAVQLHSTIRAIEATKGVKVTGVIVQGLYKGYEVYGKQSSPFCYAYHRAGNPPFTSSETTYEYRAGLKKVPTWELPGGVREWVKGMPDNILADQFPRTPTIYIKDDLINDFFAQRAIRESEISLALQMLEAHDGDEEVQASILNTSFPQRFDQCIPYFGKPCTFRNICHGVIVDPLQHGYVWREPHHKLEKDHFDGQNVERPREVLPETTTTETPTTGVS